MRRGRCKSSPIGFGYFVCSGGVCRTTVYLSYRAYLKVLRWLSPIQVISLRYVQQVSPLISDLAVVLLAIRSVVTTP